jgi:hypothetical protein
MIEAIERIRAVLRDIPLEVFESDWQEQWLVERGAAKGSFPWNQEID